MEKKLYRSRHDKKLCGVCSGIGKYLGVDPTVLRVLMVCAVLFAGSGILAYIACALIIPEEPENIVEEAADAPANEE